MTCRGRVAAALVGRSVAANAELLAFVVGARPYIVGAAHSPETLGFCLIFGGRSAT